MSDESDDQIAAGLKSGSSAAWAALYDGFFDRVWNLAGRMIGPDAQAVADVVQETFLAAAASAAGFNPRRGSLWLWLAGICRNHVAMHFRRRRWDGRVKPGGDLQADLARRWARLQESAAGPGGAAELAEQAECVRATLAELSDEHQLVLTGRYIEDIPVEQLAEQAGCSSGAMRSKLARARKAFRKAFGGAGEAFDSIRPASPDGTVRSNP